MVKGHRCDGGWTRLPVLRGEVFLCSAAKLRRVLMLQGATGTQLTTVSYGAERPAQTGSDEESWRLNRRVELVYR